MKETWSGIKKIMGYLKPNSPHLSSLDVNELNHFYACFYMIDFSKEIVNERMELNVGKNVDECFIVSENEIRKEFLNVIANKAKGANKIDR